ncbi:MAG: peptidoglycan DD-metalloendopeptidase family protein [Alphaproteobacteria bacterium]|jgi:murein DD-endopeptidase MepM/ murein hydrolase activator NlpD|nr:peptidoglycan DD-metalloendopeptidase family protein [Alphaproteobacteria bacterium]MDP7222302.1 peptidoglycan DD-metalloendopeptidase family protein [Alphaproteobacteria bacterium]
MSAKLLETILETFALRHRYVFTRRGGLRLRYVSGLCVLCLSLVSVMFVTLSADASRHPADQVEVRDEAGHDELATITPESGPKDYVSRTAGQDEDTRLLGAITRAATRIVPDRRAVSRKTTLTVGAGETLSNVMEKAGIGVSKGYKLIAQLQDVYDPRHLKVGQDVFFRFDPQDRDGSSYVLGEMRIEETPIAFVRLERDEQSGEYKASRGEKEIRKSVQAGHAEIEVSLYGSSLKAGIPESVVTNAIYIYSWDVDFQRDIRQGDSLKIMYEKLETVDGTPVPGGDVLYAELKVNGRVIPAYRYKFEDGDVDYFTDEGVSLRKALMKTPIDGARLSSGFGMRHHPVLGYNKMHKGVDFAAPRGTPIYAAGDGTIDYIGRYGGYGNYIRLRHNSDLRTAYAHMKGFKKGLSKGKRVKQGEVIGYVGTTGRSTGPHLHYEVLRGTTQINPQKLDMPRGKTLKGETLTAFKRHVSRVNAQYAQRIKDADNQKFALNR